MSESMGWGAEQKIVDLTEQLAASRAECAELRERAESAEMKVDAWCRLLSGIQKVAVAQIDEAREALRQTLDTKEGTGDGED